MGSLQLIFVISVIVDFLYSWLGLGYAISFVVLLSFLEFLKVLDDFERAEKELPKINEKNYLDWTKGMIKIKERIKKILEKEGVEEIEKKEKFLPELHEAVEWAEGEEGKILEVFEKGYFLDKKLLRPAKVKVGKGKK